MHIRAATLSDAEAIAQVHVQAWRETYQGLVPDALLAGLSVERRTRMWSDFLGMGGNAPVIQVIENGGGRVVGFGAAERARSPLLKTEGEVTAIYLLAMAKRRGTGRQLFARLLSALADRGFASAGLWALTNNVTARQFYEVMGGRTGATREEAHPTGILPEIAYVWDNLAAFTNQAAYRAD